jgi:hypothetical protein
MKIEHAFERHSRIGIGERSLDRGTQRRQVAGKCGHSPIVDQAGAALQPSDLGIDRCGGRSAPPRAATAIRSVRATAASCSAA